MVLIFSLWTQKGGSVSVRYAEKLELSYFNVQELWVGTFMKADSLC